MLKRFCKHKNIVHDFLEDKNRLPEGRDLLCDDNWLFDLAFFYILPAISMTKIRNCRARAIAS